MARNLVLVGEVELIRRRGGIDGSTSYFRLERIEGQPGRFYIEVDDGDMSPGGCEMVDVDRLREIRDLIDKALCV